jgi:hypothetical protein
MKNFDFYKLNSEKSSFKNHDFDYTNVVSFPSLRERKKEEEYKKALDNVLAKAKELDW